MAEGDHSLFARQVETMQQGHDYGDHLMNSSLQSELKLSTCNINSEAAAEIHVVMMPYPVQGHINPMMEFAQLLTATRDDIKVTIVSNKYNHDLLQQRMRSMAMAAADVDTQIGTADEGAQTDTIGKVPTRAKPHAEKLHLTWVENGLPLGFDYTDITVSNGMELYFSTIRMKEPFEQLLRTLHSKRPPVSCVLFGFLCSWVQPVAAELGITSLLFCTQSASVFSICRNIPLLVANGFFPYNKKKDLPGCDDNQQAATSDLVTYMPGLLPLHPSSFPAFLHVDNISDSQLGSIFMEQTSLVGKACGVIINSFEELEKEAWQAIQRELPHSAFLVGPLVPSDALLHHSTASNKSVQASSPLVQSDCIRWLDGKPKQSVLYISFGSMFTPFAALEGIACGIKSRKQPYLWVIRPSSSSQGVTNLLPKGFVEETKHYGLIIPWAPQVQVLAHPSVGGVLTHCGWNSTLESVSMGMPMICCPIDIDQPTNGAFVCDVWKVGILLKLQDGGKVQSEDVEKVVRMVFHEEEGLRMRERASMLQAAARQARQAQGSSSAQIEKFIQALQKSKPPLLHFT